MAESHVIGGLVSKHSELSGQIQHHQKQIKDIQRDLAAIAGAIKVIEPDFNLREIKAKTPKPNNRFFKSREASQLILEVFRDAVSDISTSEVIDRVATLKGIELDAMKDEDLKAFKATLFTIMKRMQKRGIIEEERREGQAIIWRLLASSSC